MSKLNLYMKKIVSYSIGLALLVPAMVSAQTNSAGGALSGSLNTAAGRAGLPKVSVAEMVGIIINAILSLLGIIFTVLILLGGFRWMTSQGNRDQVADAKKTIGSAMIGLLVVVASYAIARFVFSSLQGATGAGGGGAVGGS